MAALAVLLHLAMWSLLARPRHSGLESALCTSLEAGLVAHEQALWQLWQHTHQQQLAGYGGPPLLEQEEQGAVQQQAELASQELEQRPVASSIPGLDRQLVSRGRMPGIAPAEAAPDAARPTADLETTGGSRAAAASAPMPTRPAPAPAGLMLVLTAFLHGSAAAAAGVWLALLRCKRRLARLQRQAERAEAAAALQLQLGAAAGGLLPALSLSSPPRRQTPAADGVAVVAVAGGAAAAKEGEHRVAAARRSLRFPSLQRPSAYGAKHRVSPHTTIALRQLC